MGSCETFPSFLGAVRENNTYTTIGVHGDCLLEPSGKTPDHQLCLMNEFKIFMTSESWMVWLVFRGVGGWASGEG